MESRNLKEMALVAFFFSSTLAFFAPLHQYYYNIFEFAFAPAELWVIFLLSGIVISLAITILLYSFRKTSYFDKAFALLFAAGSLIWVQGHVLIWNYGPLDGREVDWMGMWPQGLADSAIWIAVFILVTLRTNWVLMFAKRAAVVLILVQMISLFVLYAKTPVPSWYGYALDDSEKFAFASGKNVIVLVLDTFQSDLFSKVISQKKSYADIFEGFTYFPDATAAYNTTRGGVPQILTGKLYDNSTDYQDFIKRTYLSSSSIPRQLKDRAWNVYLPVSEYIYCSTDIATSITPRTGTFSKGIPDVSMLAYLTLFRHSPHFMKIPFYGKIEFNKVEPYNEEAVHEDIGFLNDMKRHAEVSLEGNAFKYFHQRGMHRPFRLNEYLEYVKMQDTINSAIIQARAEIEITDRFLSKLKELGIYDESLIFIVADHGAGILAEAPMTTFGDNGHLSPLVMVKPFGAEGSLKISGSPVSLSDISATVMDELAIESDVHGRSVFSIAEGEQRRRKHFRYFWGLADWDRLRFPTMYEYTIQGHSWKQKSWSPTNRVMDGVSTYLLPLEYTPGEKIMFSQDGNIVNYLIYGWSYGSSYRTVWTVGDSFAMRMRPTGPDTDLLFSVSAKPYLGGGRLLNQGVVIMASGKEVGRWNVDKSAVYNVRIPAGSRDGSGLLMLEFILEDAVSPFELRIGQDKRKLALTLSEAILTRQ